MTTVAEAVTESQRRLEQLAHGVRDRGSVLSKGWRCEVIPRKCQLPVRGQDVVFTSPEGDGFWSTLDVYKHLRLNPHLPKGTKKRKDYPEADEDQGVSNSTSTLKLIGETAVEDLPKYLQEVPIMCNRKQGVWYLADNKVECSDTGCTTCLGRPLADRFMSRCGPNGFCRHTGMTAESIWRSAFKVDLPGHEGTSVDNYFRQHGYSLQYVRKAPKNSLGRVVHSDRVLNADRALTAKHDLPMKGITKQVPQQTQAKQFCTHEAQSQQSLQEQDSKRGLPVCKTTDTRSDSKLGDAALLAQELENLQQVVATQKASIAQLGQAVKDRDLQIATFQAGSSQKPRGGSSSSQDVAVLCNADKQEKAALQETHEQEKAAMQSAHKQELGALKAQAAQAKAEYMQILSEKQKLQDVIYDLKVSGAAHQRHSNTD